MYDAFFEAKTHEEVQRFLFDICLISDLNEFAKRLKIAMLLLDGMTRSYVNFSTGVSNATIIKINKILKNTITVGFKAIYRRFSANGVDLFYE